jgi:hypothetical protein
VVPSWLAVCWIALGSGLESQRGHLFFGIFPRGEISQEGFFSGTGFPSCHKSIYRVSEDNFRGSACVPEWMLVSVLEICFHVICYFCYCCACNYI